MASVNQHFSPRTNKWEACTGNCKYKNRSDVPHRKISHEEERVAKLVSKLVTKKGDLTQNELQEIANEFFPTTNYANCAGGYAKTFIDHKETFSELIRYRGLSGKIDASGEIHDPIDVQGNVKLAAQLIAEGKHVRLNKVFQVGSLIKELERLTDEVAGKDMKFDLCLVSVNKAQNLFCASSVKTEEFPNGIPRIHMPQLSGQPLPDTPAAAMQRNENGEVSIAQSFVNELEKHGIKVTEKSVRSDYLKASQSELSGKKVIKILRRLKREGHIRGTIFVTNDGYIIDGHHRWAAYTTLDAKDNKLGDLKMTVTEIDMEIGEALAFTSVYAKRMGIAQQSV